jgi:hypothetical protein
MDMKQSTLIWTACAILLLGQIIIFYTIVNPQLHCQNQRTEIWGGTYNDVDTFLYNTRNRERIDDVALSTYIDSDKNEHYDVVVVTCSR